MRFDRDFKFWVVVDATQESELGDVLYEASLADLELQIKGGLSAADNPTLFTDPEEAETEARARLLAAEIERQAQELADRVGDALHQRADVRDEFRRARWVAIRDETGESILEVDLKAAPPWPARERERR